MTSFAKVSISRKFPSLRAVKRRGNLLNTKSKTQSFRLPEFNTRHCEVCVVNCGNLLDATETVLFKLLCLKLWEIATPCIARLAMTGGRCSGQEYLLYGDCVVLMTSFAKISFCKSFSVLLTFLSHNLTNN